MCGRFTRKKDKDLAKIMSYYGITEAQLEIEPSYNISPTQIIPAVNQQRQLLGYKWGLIPSWAKDASIGNKLINARAETLPEKPSFRNALAKRRCLIPADGYYEWKKEGKVSQPYYFHRRDDGLFSFAGLWEEWKASDGNLVHSCTLITTEPNELAATVHNRMPAILKRSDEALWLDPAARVPDLVKLLAPYPDEEMEAYPVSRGVNTPKRDDASLVEPLN